MTLPIRTVLLLALAATAIMLAIFVIKAALAVALIVAAVFAGFFLFNFARAFVHRLSRRALPRTLR